MFDFLFLPVLEQPQFCDDLLIYANNRTEWTRKKLMRNATNSARNYLQRWKEVSKDQLGDKVVVADREVCAGI